MQLGLDEATAYLGADKSLVDGSGWQPKENRYGRYPITLYESRVRIDQAMPRGLKFRISVFPTLPNSATFQLECDQPGQRTCVTLYRMEWRPISSHTNGLGPPTPEDIRGLSFSPGETHEHICTDNVTMFEQRIIKPGVHAARRVEPDPATYDDALAYVCARIRIVNPGDVPPSNAQWSLV
jgi:hypothetical protein